MVLSLQPSSRIFSGWPVRDLIEKIGFRAETVESRITMGLFCGSTQDVLESRSLSHLTHSTGVQHQIRYPMRARVARSVRKLAEAVAPKVLADLRIRLASDDELSIEFFLHLETAGVRVTYLPYCDAGPSFANPRESDTMHLLKTPATLPGLIAAASERTYSGDYRSAYQILMRVPERFRTSDVHHLLGMCANYFDQTEESEFHFLRCLESEDVITRASAAYMISMLYLRWHKKSKHSVDQAEKFLDQAFEDIQNLSDFETREFQKVFNRNGYALCLYRRGRVSEALTMLKEGVATLDATIRRSDAEGRPSHRYLHRSVLLYNAVQCLASLEQYDECEAMCSELLSADPLFPEYHLESGRIQLMRAKGDPRRLSRALSFFESAKCLDDAIPELHALVGFTLMESGRLHEAKAAYEEALKLDPMNAQYQDAVLYCAEAV